MSCRYFCGWHFQALPSQLPSSCRILPRPWSCDIPRSLHPKPSLLPLGEALTPDKGRKLTFHLALYLFFHASICLRCTFLMCWVFFFFPLSLKALLFSPGTAPLLLGLTALKSPAPGAYVVHNSRAANGFGLQLHFSDEEKCLDALGDSIKLPSWIEGTRQYFPQLQAGLNWFLGILVPSWALGGSLCVSAISGCSWVQ